MDDIVQVQVFQSDKNTGDKEFRLILSESSPAAHMVPKIATYEQVHNQVKVLPVLKCISHIDNKRVLQFRE